MQYRPRSPDNTWGTTLNENRADQALAYADPQVTADALRGLVGPPLRQVQSFPPRFGYTPYAARQSRLEDVVEVARIYSDPRVTWTGTPAGYSGSSRNTSGNA